MTLLLDNTVQCSEWPVVTVQVLLATCMARLGYAKSELESKAGKMKMSSSLAFGIDVFIGLSPDSGARE